MKSSSLLFVCAVFAAVFGFSLIAESQNVVSKAGGDGVKVGACEGVDMTPHNNFCSKPKKLCKTQYVVVSPWGAPVPSGCDVYDAEDACPLRYGAKVAGEGGYATVVRDCGEMQEYEYSLCDDNSLNECVLVGQSTWRPCPGSHTSVTGC